MPLAKTRIRPSTPASVTTCINNLAAKDPFLAAEKIANLFIRPHRLQPSASQASFLATAQVSDITVSDIPIRVYTWPSAKRPSSTVLLTHGYGSAACSLLAFVPPLLSAGFTVVAWDHMGHGASGGDWGDLRVFKETFLMLARRCATVQAVIGHSGGVTMAVTGLIENPDVKVETVVCLSPPTRLEVIMSRFCEMLGVSAALASLTHKHLDDKGIVLPGEVRRVIEREKRKVDIGKMLIVQDRDDRVVTVEDAEWLRSHVENVRVNITQGNGHHKGLTDLRIVELVVNFVLELKQEDPRL